MVSVSTWSKFKIETKEYANYESNRILPSNNPQKNNARSTPNVPTQISSIDRKGMNLIFQ